ncbi:MAG: 2-amino-4-hydroxy-6-hydroxymethyldihydropteridine diphosphokinase, partial [Chloroflexi bacterium]|nr:2-amino-4-hydroxy-6-hydroxymethyldihydropteridine diphosphokinase [Chloroflexota bacterium]
MVCRKSPFVSKNQALFVFQRAWVSKFIESGMKNQNRIIILLGSNIRPEENLKEALALLAEYSKIKSCSRIWRTEAIGSDGPDFLNMAVDLETDLDSLEIKSRIIKNIEIRLGRVRTEDKNAPRTIDLDIILLNDEVLDGDLWKKAF